MDQMQFQMEMAAFDEKIALAELEKAKAEGRVKELSYEKVRFQMEWLKYVAAQAQDRARQQQTPAPQQG